MKDRQGRLFRRFVAFRVLDVIADGGALRFPALKDSARGLGGLGLLASLAGVPSPDGERAAVRPRGAGTRSARWRWWRDGAIVTGVLAWIPGCLLLDTLASRAEQDWLGVGTWLLLLALLIREPVRVRAQVGVVVGFASLIEYTFSGWLHVYVYRLHDVPAFVPPGHGLVYLAALTIGRAPVVLRHARGLIAATLVLAGGYAFWGLVLSGRRDVLGALWFGCLVAFLLRGRQPTVYVGAFAVVTFLELLGTHLGNWTWDVRDPVLGVVAMGNPPSVAAGGYGFFDAAALAFAPRLVAAWGQRRRAGDGHAGATQAPAAAAVATAGER